MRPSTYVRYEILRTFRNQRFLVFSLAFPLILFFVIAGPNKNKHLLGIGYPLYFMPGMAAWGTMVAVISGGARLEAGFEPCLVGAGADGGRPRQARRRTRCDRCDQR